ncbi:hypothetical protein NKG94_31840 [Micromonospora sp. M12]
MTATISTTSVTPPGGGDGRLDCRRCWWRSSSYRSRSRASGSSGRRSRASGSPSPAGTDDVADLRRRGQLRRAGRRRHLPGALVNTVIWLVLFGGLSVLGGFGMALVLQKERRGVGFYRAALFTPWCSRWW